VAWSRRAIGIYELRLERKNEATDSWSWTMPFALPDAVANRVRALMSSGEFADETAVVSAALDLLERRQRFRAMVQAGIDAADRGDVVDHETVFREARQRIAEIAAEQAQKVVAK
jgi:predicted transcriptional regulator